MRDKTPLFVDVSQKEEKMGVEGPLQYFRSLTAAIDLIVLTNTSKSEHPDGSCSTSCDDWRPQNYGEGMRSPEILIQASISCLKDFLVFGSDAWTWYGRVSCR